MFSAKMCFLHRAFDNDKLDLTELEGLADLLNAETEMQRKLALRQAEVYISMICQYRSHSTLNICNNTGKSTTSV
jgi:tRNA U34 5-carboxymethylaminomethyl modifying GTPase MnmE/TrmE